MVFDIATYDVVGVGQKQARQSMPRRDWTHDELIQAMNLYCRLPFGKFHKGNPEVIRLADVIGRTPSSVGMKLCNLASLDPAHQERGVKGLSGASEGDRRIWAEFHADWERLAVESEQLRERQRLAGGEPEQGQTGDRLSSRQSDRATFVQSPEPSFVGEAETARMVHVRLAQRFFRKAVLASYTGRCCVSEIALPGACWLPVISCPWRDFPQHRADPRNGICLSRLYDGAFDRGLITFDEEFRLVISCELRAALSNRVLRESFQPYEGQVMRLPDKFRPDPGFLVRHREQLFCG